MSTSTEQPLDVNIVKTTWSQIKEALGDNGPETVGRLIFENLFREYPYMGDFFKNYGTNTEEIMNNKKFMLHAKERVFVNFDKVVNSLDNQTEVENIAVWLAKVHKYKGIKTPDLLNLGNAILLTLEQALGSNFTPEVKQNWTMAVNGLMNGIGSFLKT